MYEGLWVKQGSRLQSKITCIKLRLNWGPQVSRAIKGANNSLQAIKMIRKYFKTSEIIQLLTSNFYSKLYYGSEIWHLPNLNSNC